MKTRSTLTERASRVRSDYAPLTPPPNPHADEARAALREYGSALFKNAPAKPVEDDLHLNDESIDLLERVLEKHGELTDEAKLARARATWPAMREPDYRLTWPGDMRGVVTVTGQWDYTDTGEIEAWYTRAQLEAAIETMQATKGNDHVKTP